MSELAAETSVGGPAAVTVMVFARNASAVAATSDRESTSSSSAFIVADVAGEMVKRAVSPGRMGGVVNWLHREHTAAPSSSLTSAAAGRRTERLAAAASGGVSDVPRWTMSRLPRTSMASC